MITKEDTKVLHYSLNTKVIQNEEIEKTIFLNRESGFWIKIPNEWKDVLDNFVNQEKELKQYLTLFEDKDNAETFQNLVNKLVKYGMLIDSQSEKRQKLHKVQLALTERCNLFCSHCCYNAKLGESNNDLDLNSIKKIIDRIVACKPDSIALSGGEPLIRKDFLNILDYLSSIYSGEITLSTNATLIQEKDIPVLIEKISAYDISLDGFDEKSCERIRGKGVFNTVISNIKKMQEYGADNISLSMVDVNHSRIEREKFKELNIQLGTRPIIRALAPIGRAVTMESKVEYMQNLYTPRTLKDEERKQICSGFRGTKCGAYLNQFFVDYNGDVYPCGLLIDSKYKMCNLLEIDDNDIFPFKATRGSSLKNLKMLEPDKIEKCKNCKINFFCWGCLQEADMLAGDSELIQKRCDLKLVHLKNIIWTEENI